MKIQPAVMALAWADLRAKALPPSAPAIQVIEMRRAFYAGGLALFNALTNMPEDLGLLDEGLEVTDDDTAQLAAISAEFQAFALAIQEGRA